MATKPLTLSGIGESAEESRKDGLLHEWRKKEQRYEEEILGLRRELDDAHTLNEKLERSLRTLRKQLNPLHLALRAVFGEIELAVGQDDFSPPTASASPAANTASGNSDFWEKWKSKLGGKQADIIDALMGHPGMTTTAVGKAAGCRVTTASTLLSRLNGMNLVEKNGGLWRLKSI